MVKLVKKQFKRNSDSSARDRGGHAKKTIRDLVPKFKYFAKASLASYADEEGCAIHIGQSDDEKDFFISGAIAKTRKQDNCELGRRLGMGLCLSASSFDAGSRKLMKLAPQLDNFHQGKEQVKKYEKTGLAELLRLLTKPAGAEFRKAVGVLNAGKTKRPSREKVEQAVNHLLAFFDHSGVNLRKSLPRVSVFTSSMYIFSMTLLELLDLHEHKKAWTALLKDDKGQPKAVKSWIQKPQDKKKYAEALVDAFLSKVKQNKKEKTCQEAEDSSSEGIAGSTDSSKDSDGRRIDSEDDSDVGDGTESSSSKDSDKGSNSDSRKGPQKKNKEGGGREGTDKWKSKIKDSSDSAEEDEIKENKDKKTNKIQGIKKDAGIVKDAKSHRRGAAANPLSLRPRLPNDGDATKRRAAIALSSWSAGDAQIAQAKLQTWITTFGDTISGPSLVMLKDLAKNIPDEICCWTEIDELKNDVMQKKTLSNDAFRFVLQTFCAAVSTFLELRTSHTGQGAASSAGQSEPKKDTSKESSAEDAA